MILLDTCSLLWLVMQPSALSDAATQCLRAHRGSLFVSAVSAFEIGQKHAAAKLELPLPPADWFDRACSAHGLDIIPLQPRHAFRASSLPPHHRDPFDRLLIGTAAVEQLSILTPDPAIHRYSEASRIW